MDYSEKYIKDQLERTHIQSPEERRIDLIKKETDQQVEELTEDQITAHQDEDENDRRLVVLGLTASGKSSTGNKILGYKEFGSRLSPKPVTYSSQKGVRFRFGRNVSVTDTPGIDNSELNEQEIAYQMANLVMMSAPGPHCFLLTIPVGPVNGVLKKVMYFMKEIFGEEMFNRTIVVFTRADELKRNNMSVEDFIRGDPDLSVIVERCNKFVSFDNTTNDESDVLDLLNAIDEIAEQFTPPFYDKCCFSRTAKANEHLRQIQANKDEKIKRVMKPVIESISYDIKQLNNKVDTVQNSQQKESEKYDQLEQFVRREILNLQQSVKRNERRNHQGFSRVTAAIRRLKEDKQATGANRMNLSRGLHRQHPYKSNDEK